MYNIKRFSRGRQIRITLAGVFGKILGYSMNTLTGPWREIDMDSWMALSPAGIIQLLQVVQVLHFSPQLQSERDFSSIFVFCANSALLCADGPVTTTTVL